MADRPRTMGRRRGGILGVTLSLWSLAASVHATEPEYRLTVKKAEDRIALGTNDTQTEFTVTSRSGIGAATITLAAGSWPDGIVLRLRYGDGRPFDSLEGFGLATERLRVEGSLRESGRMPYYPAAGEGAGESHQVPAGHAVIVAAGKDGAMEIRAPRELLAGARRLDFSWIDVYR